MSNTVGINEQIADVVAHLLTDERYRLFRYAPEEELGYTRSELNEVNERIYQSVLDSLIYPNSNDEASDAKAPYTRSYIHSKTFMCDTLERALLYIDGGRTLNKWWPLLPELHVHVENNRAYLIDDKFHWTWVGGEPEESDTPVAKLNNDVIEWSADKESLKSIEKISTGPPQRLSVSNAVDRARDLEVGQKFSLTPGGFVYEVLKQDPDAFWTLYHVSLTVVAKKWRKVVKSIQKVGKSHRTTKEIIPLDDKTKVRSLDLAKDRRVYIRK